MHLESPLCHVSSEHNLNQCRLFIDNKGDGAKSSFSSWRLGPLPNDSRGERKRGRGLEFADRTFGLAEAVIDIAVANVAPGDVQKGHDQAVGAVSGALEDVGEVMWPLAGSQIYTERDKASRVMISAMMILMTLRTF
ncbi:hypothetical protein S40288_11472 [Stachybotrys chartarum IBT 40288]|nr:hypothetical protein S40288_11472 [Stachybotrys chartarum IBT 40288]